jgi:hypothetical protein
MKKASAVASMVSVCLVTGLTIFGANGAAADTESVLSVDPVEPSVANVCWTPYTPDPETSVVTAYRLTTDPGGGPVVFDPNTTPPGGDGRYCSQNTNFKSATKYTFTLEAQIDGARWVPAASGSFVALPYALSANLSTSKTKVGKKVTVSGQLKQAGKLVTEAPILLQKKVAPNADWNELANVTTNSNGKYSHTFVVRKNTKVRAYFAGYAGKPTVGAWNTSSPIDVSPVFSLSFNKNPIRLGRTVTASGAVKSGDLKALAGENICLQKKVSGSWGGGACVQISDTGRFSYRFTPTSKADHYYRWRASSIAPEYVAGNSKKKRLVVR